MQIYHGGFMEIEVSKILKPSHVMDFGTGFYTTTSFEQAKKWSLKKKTDSTMKKMLYQLLRWITQFSKHPI